MADNKEFKYLEAASLGDLATITQQWVETSAFAEIKGCDQDAVRRAARRGDLEATKVFGVVLFKMPEYSEKNAAWTPEEGSSRSTREDGRKRYELWLLDGDEFTQAQEMFGDQLIDPRAKRAAKKAASDQATLADAPVEAAADSLDTNPFAGLLK